MKMVEEIWMIDDCISWKFFYPSPSLSRVKQMAGSSSSSTTSNEYFSDICDKLLGIHRNDPLSMKITKGVKYNDPYVIEI